MRMIAMMAATILAGLAARPGHAQAVDHDTTAQVAHGKQVYTEQRCRVCHSIAGDGSRRYPLDGTGSRLTAGEIRKWIVAPREMNAKVRKRAYDKLPPGISRHSSCISRASSSAEAEREMT